MLRRLALYGTKTSSTIQVPKFVRRTISFQGAILPLQHAGRVQVAVAWRLVATLTVVAAWAVFEADVVEDVEVRVNEVV